MNDVWIEVYVQLMQAMLLSESPVLWTLERMMEETMDWCDWEGGYVMIDLDDHNPGISAVGELP